MKQKPKVKPRKPPTPSPATADAFVRGGAAGGGGKNERITVYLPPALRRRAEHVAVDRRVSFSALVAEALEALLAQRK
jgi:hypothetical protein